MVGAALEDRGTHVGLIVDGLHVHPAALRVALMARGSEGAMLVTDAMPPVGGQGLDFTLMGTRITVKDGDCRGPDGTLAGSGLSMIAAFNNTITMLGQDLVTASRMASGNPARFLRLSMRPAASRRACAPIWCIWTRRAMSPRHGSRGSARTTHDA